MPIDFNVEVQVWGAEKDAKADPILKYIDSELFGSHPGHGALVLNLPKDPAGKYEALLEKYCWGRQKKDGSFTLDIPYHVDKFFINGQPKEFFVVRFSWGFNYDGSPYLFKTLQEERDLWLTAVGLAHRKPSLSKSVHQEIDVRAVKGILGKREIELPKYAKLAQLDDQIPLIIKSIIRLKYNVHKDKNQRKSLELLKNKLDTLKQSEKLDDSTLALIKNLLGIEAVKLALEYNSQPKEDASDERLVHLKSAVANEQKKVCLAISKGKRKVDNIIKVLYKKKYGTDAKSPAWKIWSSSYPKMDELLGELEDIQREVLVLGQKEDTVSLPLFSDGDKSTMDLEAMLIKMRDLVDNEKYDVYTLNCCQAVLKVLEAGAPKQIKSIAKRRYLGAIATPQQVINVAHSMAREINNPDFIEEFKVKDIFITDILLGYIINKYFLAVKKDEESRKEFLDKKARESGELESIKLSLKEEATFFKARAKVALFAVALLPVISTLFILKHLILPVDFLNKCVDMLRYAFHTKNTKIKIIAATFLFPAILVHIIPAVIEFVSIKVLKGFRALFKSIVGTAGRVVKKSDTLSSTETIGSDDELYLEPIEIDASDVPIIPQDFGPTLISDLTLDDDMFVHEVGTYQSLSTSTLKQFHKKTKSLKESDKTLYRHRISLISTERPELSGTDSDEDIHRRARGLV